MKTLMNYIGILRLYSLVDLILLLVVIHQPLYQFLGAMLLHISFLFYLESKHAHSYRIKIPIWLSYICAVIGLILYGKIEGVGYILTSYIYTNKTKCTGFLSPFARAFQNLFLCGGILGFTSQITYIIAIIFLLRNLLGDVRDIEKDRKEGVRTIPVLIGFKKGLPYIHLYAVIASSCVWWLLSSFPIGILVIVVCIEFLTYNLTPR